MNPAKFFAFVFLCAALAGCATGPIEDTRELSAVDVPESWWNGETTRNRVVEEDWLSTLGDRQLSSFVESVLVNNYALKAGMARLAQADASVRLQAGAKFPTLGLDFTHGMQESFSELFGIVVTDINSLALSSSWEMDIWGRVRKEEAAAYAQLQAAGYSYADLILTLQATLAKTWFAAVEARQQLELAVLNRDSFSNNLETLEDRYLKGLVEAFDLRLFRAQAAANEAVVKQREAALKTLIYQLQALASLVPGGQLPLSDALPVIENQVPAGIPSEVLLRRPDIRAAERQLASTVGYRDASAKNWLPSFRISSSFGTSSNEIGELIDGDRLIWSLIGNMTAPLFQGGRLKAQRDLTEAQFQEQLNLYNQTLLDALTEVETALMRESMLAEVESVIVTSATEARKAEEQAWELYSRGLRDITAVLDTQRRSVSAQSELLSVKNQRLQNRIDLHVALGGGFNFQQSPVEGTMLP